MNNYTVYKHTSPSGKIYVGITSRNPIKRWNGGTGYINNEYFTRAINKYGWNNIQHEILFTGLSKEEAETKEIELIALYRSDERDYGYNIQHGGNAIGKHAEETKMKIGKANKGKLPWNTGKHRDEETRKKLSDYHTGTHLSQETKQKISLAHKGRKQDAEVVRKRAESCRKKVKCVETGEVFASVKQAGCFAKVVSTAVSACLKGKTQTAGGYHWEYV